ncbi:Oidioi.mRNA.OKI2018_I69.chr2.g8234.t1.cds [Oikopleura dioica]|uniref:Oidioi.mRNA.OKI2018_I69.chr2.g8234.t1.cds n=1 Tax=Oikopleura dioica TaxID=34765 RepID=A0ABN7TBZ3_OIKDI|nr:Oidioi.mRNA.OKI2018_I69.chr2.g8234.t1.cds [Oikopleura dioica]
MPEVYSPANDRKFVIVLILTIAAIILFAIQLESLPKLDLKQKIEDGFEGFKFEIFATAANATEPIENSP